VAVCTNNKVGYRPISFYGLMTRVATGSKFGMIFFFACAEGEMCTLRNESAFGC